MADPNAPRPRSRTADHLGCVAVALGLVALIGSLVWAFRQPAVGIPVLVVVVLVDVMLLRLASRREREARANEYARLMAIAPPEGNAWRRLLEAEGLAAHIPRLATCIRPAIRLTTRAGADLPIGASRIGGVPDLPADLPWPRSHNRPLAFLAQFDLAEVHAAQPDAVLPATGTMWFFLAVDPWDFDPAEPETRVILYRPAGAALTRATAPVDLGKDARFPACALTLTGYEDLPPLDEEKPEIPDEGESETYVEIRDFLSKAGGEAAHKLLGHANAIQGEMALQCELESQNVKLTDPRARELTAAAADWRLLLQLDTDCVAEMMWGDAGSLYVWIKDADLRQLRFDRAWVVFQCY